MNLYKFREVNTNNLTALANNQLWFSSLNDFNDPFEGSHIKDNYVPSEVLSIFKSKTKDEIGHEQFKEMLDEMGLKEEDVTNEELFQKIAEHDLDKLINIIHSSKIVYFSLGETTKDPITNNLMWSHYANGLRGFCLVFDGDILLKDIYSSTSESMRPIVVEYKDQPNILKLNDFIHSESILNNKDINFVQEIIETIATKSSDWEYENEFRIMSLEKNDFHNYSSDSLKEIIIGEKMPNSQKHLVLSTVKASNPDIIVKEARLKPDSYLVEIVPV